MNGAKDKNGRPLVPAVRLEALTDMSESAMRPAAAREVPAAGDSELLRQWGQAPSGEGIPQALYQSVAALLDFLREAESEVMFSRREDYNRQDPIEPGSGD